MAFGDFDDLVDYGILQPQGDRLCHSACGGARQLLPEEADLCADCAAHHLTGGEP